MSKITIRQYTLAKKENDLEILLRERLVKYLATREKSNLTLEKEDLGNDVVSIYRIESNKGDIYFRYKVGIYNNKMTFRLCNVSFSEKNRRKGILTDMMGIVKDFAPRYGIKILQVECPHTKEILSWLKKNGYRDLGTDMWEKPIEY